MLKTIKIRGFTYYKRVPHPSAPDEEIVQAAFATRGEQVDLSDADVKRGEEIDAFVNEDEPAEEVVEFEVVDVSDDEIDEYLENETPNVKDTIALAKGDVESAQRLLDAEYRVTGGAPRQGVVDGLGKIIEG